MIAELWECDQEALHTAAGSVDRAEITMVEKDGRDRLTALADRDRTLAVVRSRLRKQQKNSV